MTPNGPPLGPELPTVAESRRGARNIRAPRFFVSLASVRFYYTVRFSDTWGNSREGRQISGARTSHRPINVEQVNNCHQRFSVGWQNRTQNGEYRTMTDGQHALLIFLAILAITGAALL